MERRTLKVEGKIDGLGKTTYTIKNLNFKLYISFVLFTLTFLHGYSQDFDEKWIVNGQKYYKIKTAEDGMYRISYQDLVSAGFPLTTPGFNKRKIQLFHRGVEQAIYIPGALDGVLGTSDYVEFYGKKNDGTLDAQIYKDPSLQPHTYYNLYSDTTAFFLTYAFGTVTGKRMEVRSAEFNTGGLPKEPYHLDEKLLVYTSEFSEGQYYPLGSNSITLLSEFDTGEGWTGPKIAKAGNRAFSISEVANIVSSGPKPILSVLLAGRNNRKHNVSLLAGSTTSSLRSIKTIEFNYYSNTQISENIEFSDIAAGKTEIQVKVNGFADANPDYASVSYIRLTYPQSYIMSGTSKIFNVPSNPNGKSFIEISSASATSVIYDITDPNNIKRLNYFISGSTINTVVSNTLSGRKLLVVNNDYKIAKASGINFKTIHNSANYLIVSSALLRQPVGAVTDPVREYGSYRASVTGGGFDTLTVNIEQLYDQFTYGEVSPLAVKRFAAYMLNHGNPKYLLILGKGLHITLKYFRTSNWDNVHRDIIPPMGFPGSDVLYTSGLNGAGLEPAIPTGRVSARTPEEVVRYLNKIKEMESLPFDDLWRKRLIHLSGGVQASEIELFRSYTDGFGEIAKDKYLGGSVNTISKTSTLNVEYINIAELVNSGSNLITFFGHSGTDITDIEIGKASEPINGYTNKGKYPMIYVNGCNAGDIYNKQYSLGEDWTLAEEKGSIAFYASSHQAYAGPLKRFADMFYHMSFGDSVNINKSIGEINQALIKKFLETYATSELYITQATEMVLQGDPAYKLFNAPKPDYNTSESFLYLEAYDKKKITALTDSFALGVIVRNLGRVTSDSIEIKVKRILESGTNILIDTVVASVFNQDTILFNIKAPEEVAYGLNTFEVTIDPLNKISELNELNNLGSIEYFIPLAKVIAIAPNEFSIMNSQEVTLMAQNTDIVSGSQQYIFEIDTSFNFNSGWKKTQAVSSSTIPAWKVNVSQLKDTTIYYWRVKLNTANSEEEWYPSSFTYIKNGPEGWAQGGVFQYLKDNTSNITKNTTTRKLDFTEVLSKFKAETFANDTTDSYKLTKLLLNNFAHVFEGRCGNNNLLAVAFNRITAEPYLVFNKLNYGSTYYCGRTFNEIANRMSDAQIKGSGLLLENYIDNLPNGDFVLLFSSGLVNYEQWPLTTKNKLAAIGVDLNTFNKLKNGQPYIVFGQKGGAVGSAIQTLPKLNGLGEYLSRKVEYGSEVTGRYDRGTLTTTKIGPSQEWHTLYKKSSVDGVHDSFNYDVIGLDVNNQEHVLASQVEKDTLDLTFIDASQYRNLVIRSNFKDSVNLTPAILKRMQVSYITVPEGVVYAVPGQKLDSINVDEGAEININYVFKNISNKDFKDSIAIKETLVNNTTLTKNESTTKYKPLPQNDSIPFSIKVSTFGKVGVSTLQAYVNPKIQLEQNYFNNIVSLNRFLTVNRDASNPILDVVFDGAHIMDGDLVSPNPLINITLKDDSKYKFKKDTIGLEVYLKEPCEGCDFQRISFSDPQIKWQPADENNKFKIEYQPKALSNGRSVLLVQGIDDSGNKSGVAPYQVGFEVINESSISNFYPYPNPFSTKTRFVFRLTGREIPDEIKIIIMTISGKVVREINQDELGPIVLGDNKTEFFWDGTDQYGDRLANGVYLYKVTVKKDGISLNHRDTAGDKGFHKGFGKMYILR